MGKLRHELSPEDRERFKQHPEIGARMILPLRLPAEIGQILLIIMSSTTEGGIHMDCRAKAFPYWPAL